MIWNQICWLGPHCFLVLYFCPLWVLNIRMSASVIFPFSHLYCGLTSSETPRVCLYFALTSVLSDPTSLTPKVHTWHFNPSSLSFQVSTCGVISANINVHYWEKLTWWWNNFCITYTEFTRRSKHFSIWCRQMYLFFNGVRGVSPPVTKK